MLIIDSVTVVTPKSFQVDISDLDGATTRNAKGTLIRYRIAIKRKLICEWPPLTQTQCAALLGAVSKIFFTVQYPDPILGTTTKTFYVGDRSIPMLTNADTTPMWEGVKLDLIEQ